MQSILTKSQFREFNKVIKYDGKDCDLLVQVRFDDRCGNGHNTLSVTGSIHKKGQRSDSAYLSGGCIDEEIEKHFPELKEAISYHLVSSDGPMHYVANSLYHASARDCWGLLKGEKRQIKNGKTGLPAWHLVAIDKNTGEEKEIYTLGGSIDSENRPDCPYVLEYRPLYRIGKGKEIDLEAARKCAIWPEANIEDFTKENLEKRLPKILENLKRIVENLGMTY